MSREAIDAMADYSILHGTQIMLIASRRQIETEEYGNGYVEGFSTESFAKYVRGLNASNLVMCRDHGGPFQGSGEADLTPDDALERSLTSFKADVDAGFHLLHVDCSYFPNDVYEATRFLITELRRYAEAQGETVLFEIGTEENVGTASDLDKFRLDLEMAIKSGMPEFVVGQTGSLVKGTSQIGKFNLSATTAMVNLAHEMGVKFKEHNVDYTGVDDFRERRLAGVDAINIAPELGVAQTRVVIDLARKHDEEQALDRYLQRATDSGMWKKWLHNGVSDNDRPVIAGHYCFTSDEYRALIEALRHKCDVSDAIARKLTELIDLYCTALNPE